MIIKPHYRNRNKPRTFQAPVPSNALAPTTTSTATNSHERKPPAEKNHSNSIKIHVFLAHAGIASRRKAEEMVVNGLVRINGTKAEVGQRVQPQKDNVEVEGRTVSQDEPNATFLMYKPVGVVSTTDDELNRQTVVEFLKRKVSKDSPTVHFPRLYPVGRLDKESEGLMVLTNDGNLTHKLTHPSFEVPKTYRVFVDTQPSELALNHLRRGVKLVEGYTAPAEVSVIEFKDQQHHQAEIEITIHEGRNQQVRRMFRRVGYEVVRLIRTSLGPWTIDMLGTAPYRQLTDEEVHSVL
jgi:pseudouridine synthase